MVMLAAVWICTACEQKDTLEQRVEMPISICLPADAVATPARKPGMNRMPGDVGTTEDLLLPKYIYFFIVKQIDADNWKVWSTVTIDDADEHWEKQYYVGQMMGSMDSIYRYTEKIILPLADQKFNGRVYAIASLEELAFDATINTTTSTLENLLDLKFSTAGEMQNNLQHIYSTPYNYNIGGKYYGSFTSIDINVPYVNLMLYHVAAKVDINWNVAAAKRKNANPSEVVRLTRMEACKLFNGDAYCFKPMENTSGATPLESGSTVTIVTAADEGLWWEGRSYFYTIPYTSTGKENYYPLQMRMETNGSGDIYTPTIYLHIDTESPFVPWLRATFNISNTLPAGTDTKTVD